MKALLIAGLVIRLGLVADIQYADCDAAGNRYYRSSLEKLEQAVEELNREGVAFTVNLGDLVDRDTEQNLGPVMERLGELDAPVYNITGNHDYGGVTDNEALYRRMGMRGEGGYYSVREAGWRFVMLNTNEREPDMPPGASYNGGVGREQMEWLEGELGEAREEEENVLVFSHHPLYGVRGLMALNHEAVAEMLAEYNDVVRGAIAGHHHAGAYGEWGGIPFITVEGMVETEGENAFSVVSVYGNKIEVEGRERAKSYTIQWSKK